MDLMQGTGRDIARGEAVEHEIDASISRRDTQRRQAEGDRAADALWVASEKAHDARRRDENRAAWCEYHRGQAERHRRNLAALVSYHEAAAEGLMETTSERSKA